MQWQVFASEADAWAVGVALVLMALDMVSGFVGAAANGEVKSSKMREGLWHKASEVLVIVLAFVIQVACEHVVGLPYADVTVVAVCGFIVVMEVGSVLENIAKANPNMKDSGIFKLFANNEEEN